MNSQSNVIFGALLVAFIIFITMRGHLPAYLQALLWASSGEAERKQAEAYRKTPAQSDPTGAFGQAAESAGQAKANQWINSIPSWLNFMFGG